MSEWWVRGHIIHARDTSRWSMGVAQTILIVEDEAEIAELIRFHIEREGFQALIAHSGQVAMTMIQKSAPALVILDLMLPDLNGLEVCRRLKRQDATREIPILMVTAKGEEADIVTGIELGADDYMTKPFSPRVLMARLRNVLRRRVETAAPPAGDAAGRTMLAGGDLVIDSDRHKVWVGGRPVGLTLTEFSLLQYLSTRPGFVRTRDQIISAVHGQGKVLTKRTVDVHITALRRKLGDTGCIIETVRGVGYRLSDAIGQPTA
jgi:two-component system phosphate regulon response regulator PhoB